MCPVCVLAPPGVFLPGIDFQEAVQELHEALAGGGGGATFIMDDGYCYGRSEEILPAIRRFADRLTDLGLHLQFGKCFFYSPRTLPSAILAELDALGISPGGVMRTPEGAEATQTGARHSAFPSRHHRRRCAIGSWVMRRSSGSTCPR